MHNLDKSLIALEMTSSYNPAMKNQPIRSRILEAMQAQGASKAELSRRSAVPYHALDKFLKGVTEKTSHENIEAICKALGLNIQREDEFIELRRLFSSLPEDKQKFALASIRGLAAQQDD